MTLEQLIIEIEQLHWLFSQKAVDLSGYFKKAGELKDIYEEKLKGNL